jgi:Phosphate-starvation-inducible E family
MQSTLPNAAHSRIHINIYSFWRTLETVIYTAVACVLALTALIGLVACGFELWQGLRTWDVWDTMLRVIGGLLVVLMLVEILHTVRISIRSHVIIPEPFLIVCLIATIRRILVIALEAANLSRPETWRQEGETMFRASVIELALLGLLVLILVTAICLLRRSPASPEEDA